MNQRATIALMTIVLLGAGYGAGWWTAQSRCKVPPPPPALLGELSPKSASAPAEAAAKKEPGVPPGSEWMVGTIDKLRPQIEVFREKMDAIDREMDRRIEAILRPEQLPAFHDLVKGGQEYRAREEAENALPTKLTADEFREVQRRPLYRLLSIVVVPIRVHWNTKQLKLDPAQKEQLTEILKWRREKFFQLIDTSPPPSLELSTLAPMAQRLARPEKK